MSGGSNGQVGEWVERAGRADQASRPSGQGRTGGGRASRAEPGGQSRAEPNRASRAGRSSEPDDSGEQAQVKGWRAEEFALLTGAEAVDEDREEAGAPGVEFGVVEAGEPADEDDDVAGFGVGADGAVGAAGGE